MKQTQFDAIGGLPALQRVRRVFYDKEYAHPWPGRFFEDHSQQAIEYRHTSFMTEKRHGPVEYRGKDIKDAHEAMYVTAELFEVRHALLEASLREAGIEPALRERRLEIDRPLMKQIAKDSVESFYRTTWPYRKRIIVPRPPAAQLE